jgi:type II secretory pathway component PulC
MFMIGHNINHTPRISRKINPNRVIIEARGIKEDFLVDPIASIAIQQALGQQAVSLALIKQDAQQGQAVAGILEQSAQNIAALTGRGGNVDILA